MRDSATDQRQLVASIVVPPLALSFGAIGVIANAMALFLLIPGLIVAMLVRHPARGLLRTLRLASVIAPWLAVTAAILFAPPVPFADDPRSDGQGFSRIARQARDVETPLWTELWLRMIGVEAELLGAMPGGG